MWPHIDRQDGLGDLHLLGPLLTSKGCKHRYEQRQHCRDGRERVAGKAHDMTSIGQGGKAHRMPRTYVHTIDPPSGPEEVQC
jgi:hypothetical protein